MVYRRDLLGSLENRSHAGMRGRSSKGLVQSGEPRTKMQWAPGEARGLSGQGPGRAGRTRSGLPAGGVMGGSLRWPGSAPRHFACGQCENLPMPKSIRADFSEGFREDDVEAARACMTLAGVSRVYVMTSRPPSLAVELAPEAPTPEVMAIVSYLRGVAHLGNIRLTDECA